MKQGPVPAKAATAGRDIWAGEEGGPS